jgi:peptide/nickel transport system permease protein
LPILAPKLAVFWAVQLPANIVTEATLSCLGAGIAAPTPSLGNMIAEAQRSGLYQVQPWLLLAPGLALFLAVSGSNLLAAGLRTRLDPTLANSR